MEHLNGFIVDSSVLTEYRSGAGVAKKIFLGALEKKINLVVCTITISNIWRDENFDRKLEISFSSLFQFLNVVPIGYEEAKEVGHLLRKSGREGIYSLEIASVATLARRNKYSVIASDPKLYEWTGVTAFSSESVLQIARSD